MKSYKKHIDNFFREKLGSYRETPPPDAWEELESKLDGLKPGAPGANYRWLIHAGIVSVLLILSVSIGKKITGNTDNYLGNAQMGGTNTANRTAAITVAASPAQNQDNATIAGSTAQPALPASAASLAGQARSVQHGSNNNTAADNKSNTRNPAAKNKGVARRQGQTLPEFLKGNTTGDDVTGGKSKIAGKLSNPGAAEEENDNTQIQATSPNTTLSVVGKPASPANPDKKQPGDKQKTSTANNDSRTRKEAGTRRLEAGIKSGYEAGFSKGSDNKLVVSPYLQYNLTHRLAVMTQPGIKFASTPAHTISSQTYYIANPEDMQVTAGTTKDSLGQTIGSTTPHYFVTPYHFAQTHDSIVKTNKIGGSSTQYELPVLLKYNLSKKLSVYGGVNFVYNKLTRIVENTYLHKSIQRTYDTTVATTGTPVVPGFSFNYAGSPFTDYKKLSASHTGYEFSTGFMIGFSYAWNRKWLLDGLVEQSPATPDVKGGYNINSPLSAAYFRLSVGYRLLK